MSWRSKRDRVATAKVQLNAKILADARILADWFHNEIGTPKYTNCNDFVKTLKSEDALVNIMNKLFAQHVGEISGRTQLERITSFRKACKKLGIPDESICGVSEITSRFNHRSVFTTLKLLKQKAGGNALEAAEEKVSENKANVICSRNCGNLGTKYCQDCGCAYCDSCCSQFHSAFITRGHSISEVHAKKMQEKNLLIPTRKRHEEKAFYCDKHPKRELEMYCSTDQECICLLCYFASHQDHNAAPITTEIVNDRKTQLKKKLITLQKEQYRLNGMAQKLDIEDKQIHKDSLSAIEKIKAVHEELQERINGSERAYLKQVRIITATTDGSLQQSRETIESHIWKITTSIETARTISNTNDIEFLSKCNGVLEDLAEAKESSKDVDPDSQGASISVYVSAETLKDITQSLPSIIGINGAPKPIKDKGSGEKDKGFGEKAELVLSLYDELEELKTRLKRYNDQRYPAMHDKVHADIVRKKRQIEIAERQ